MVYTGNILSSDKSCAGVKWFRTSKRCVYVYERWSGLTNVAHYVYERWSGLTNVAHCQPYFDGGGRHRYFTVSSTSRVRKMLSFKLISLCVHTNLLLFQVCGDVAQRRKTNEDSCLH